MMEERLIALEAKVREILERLPPKKPEPKPVEVKDAAPKESR